MLRKRNRRRRARLVAAGLVLMLAGPLSATSEQGRDKKASLSLRATPQMALAPARIFVSAEVRGGPDDAEDLYCPTVEWDWGDGTQSISTADCDPYEAGRSEIRRRFATEHVYRQPGQHRIQLRLKQGNRITLAGTTTVHVRSGLPGATER